MCQPAPIDAATITKLRATGDATQDEVWALIRALDEERQYRDETDFTGRQLVHLLVPVRSSSEQPVQTLRRILTELHALRALNHERHDLLDLRINTRLEHASGVPPTANGQHLPIGCDVRPFPRRS